MTHAVLSRRALLGGATLLGAAALLPAVVFAADDATSSYEAAALWGYPLVETGRYLKLAQDKGASQGVKDFGKMLADDHGKHKDQVAKVATAMNVPTTEETKPEADELYTKLQGLSGADFDKAFVAGMIDDHQKDIDKYQKEADSSDPAQVTDLAKQTLPTLKKHLQTAQSLKK